MRAEHPPSDPPEAHRIGARVTLNLRPALTRRISIRQPDQFKLTRLHHVKLLIGQVGLLQKLAELGQRLSRKQSVNHLGHWDTFAHCNTH